MIIDKTERRVLEVGVYGATIASIVEVEGLYGPELQFNFAVFLGEAVKAPTSTGSWPTVVEDTVEMRGWAKQILSNDSKLGRWMKNLLGEIPTRLNTEDLIGKPCVIEVTKRSHASGIQSIR